VSTHCYRWGSNDFQFDIQYYSKSLIALNEAKLASHTEQSFSSGFPGIGYGLLSSVSGENSDTMDLDFLLHGTKEGIALVAGLFPIPAISTNEDFSLWKKMDAQRSGVNEFVLGNSSQAAPNSPNEDPEDTSLSKSVSIHHQFALRLKEPAQQAITQTGTFLRVIRKSNVTTLLNPPTQNMEFTIKAGEKASNVIDIHGPIPDTAPEAGIEKRAYLLPVDLDIVHPATGELAEDREDGTSSSPDGGYVSVKRTVGSDVVGDDDVTPITKLKIHAIAGAQSTWKTRVKFSGADRYIIYKNEDRTEEVISEQTEFDATQTTTLYLQGLKKSLSRGGESIMMQVKVGNDWVDGDSVKCTIVQSEFLIQIRAFIPYEWTEGESLWLINGVNPMNGKVAQGDDREATLQFKNVFSDKDENFSVAPYRLCHEVILTPYPALHYFYQDIEPERKFSSAPTSDHYNKATSVNPSEMAQRNGYADLLSSPIASGPPVVFPPTYAPYLLYYNSLRPNKCGLDLTASGKDGAMGIFTAASPAIDWDIGLEIDASIDPLQPRIRALGKHDLYPAYEIIVLQSDGSFKDIHRHMPNRDVYPGPISLSTAPSVDFDNTRIITQ
jgi:hypothetical protein